MGIDTNHLRRKYARQPLLNGRYWTPAGSKDVIALCNEVDYLQECVKILEKKLKGKVLEITFNPFDEMMKK